MLFWIGTSITVEVSAFCQIPTVSVSPILDYLCMPNLSYLGGRRDKAFPFLNVSSPEGL